MPLIRRLMALTAGATRMGAHGKDHAYSLKTYLDPSLTLNPNLNLTFIVMHLLPLRPTASLLTQIMTPI